MALFGSVAAAAHEVPANVSIFNAVHSSMRQWGSSVYHNGMSFFLASVPAGTQLYHGTNKEEPVTGTEWLAFEPEHSLVFARMSRPPRGPHPGPPRGGPSDAQKPLTGKADEGGYLHTYAAARDLRLLYLDGMSAGKTQNGTLDLQDRILLNDTVGQTMDEGKRAQGICQLIREKWDDRLDGVIRMEAGFEIILCSFERDLDFLRAIHVQPHNNASPRRQSLSDSPDKGHGPPNGGSWLQAVTSRYHGIGGNRVRVNYDHFVTVFTRDLDIFGGESKEYRPRLQHLTSASLDPVRQEMTDLILTHDTNEPSFNWQVIADMIVTRFSHALKYISSGPGEERFYESLEQLLGPFIDYKNRDIVLETARCASQSIPLHAPKQGTAALAVRSVAQDVCKTLLEAVDVDYQQGVDKIRGLVEYLAWTSWKECTGCKDNEICVIPIWPMGTEEDYEHPTCRDIKEEDSEGGKSYWGQRHGPGSH